MSEKNSTTPSQVDAVVNWPQIGQEVKMHYAEKIGVVNDVKMIGNTEKALVDWGLYETWVATFNLEAVDS